MKSEIRFSVELDDKRFPESIHWEATDNPNEGINDTRAIAVAVWDHYHKGTLKIDLWTKQMEVFDMKRFYIEIMQGISETLVNATGDRKTAARIGELCKELSNDLKEEMEKAAKGEV